MHGYGREVNRSTNIKMGWVSDLKGLDDPSTNDNVWGLRTNDTYEGEDCDKDNVSTLIYEGEFSGGSWHGRGKLILPTGDIYEGEFADGCLHGQGTLSFSISKAVYEGQWENGMRNGHGVLSYEDGAAFYDGMWKNNDQNGHGVFVNDEGMYEGEWRDGYQHGKGKMTYINRDLYIGEWERGMRHGKGVLIQLNGDVYDGEWRNDMSVGVRCSQDEQDELEKDEEAATWDDTFDTFFS
jgi:hypothetical protein